MGSDGFGSGDAMRGSEVERAPGPVPVFDTSELRWFAIGPVPDDVLGWFLGERESLTVEERADVYHLHAVDGLGVKFRGGTMLEVKQLQSVGDPVDLGNGLTAPLTRWSKSRPAEDTAWTSVDVASVEVSKRIVKRSFGPEDSLPPHIEMPAARLTPGCNVEVTSVWVDAIESWTFAFEAYGPLSMRHSLVIDAWAALIGDASPPSGLARHLDVTAAYPVWLRQTQEVRLAVTPNPESRSALNGSTMSLPVGGTLTPS